MIQLAQRLVHAGILMTWGSVLCGLYFSGRIESYLVPAFQPFVAACGIMLGLLAMLVLFAPPGAESGCATQRSLLKSLLGATVLIAAPLVALATSKDEFGATTVLNRNYVTDVARLPAAAGSVPSDLLPGEDPARATSELPPAPLVNAKGDVQAEVIDLLYAAQLPEMRPTFEGRQVEVIGQLMPAKEYNPKGDRFDVVRMFMTCCAADVQPIALAIHPAEKPSLPEMTWVKVSGQATFPIVGGQHRPLIEGATIEKTQPPEDTFLY